MGRPRIGHAACTRKTCRGKVEARDRSETRIRAAGGKDGDILRFRFVFDSDSFDAAAATTPAFASCLSPSCKPVSLPWPPSPVGLARPAGVLFLDTKPSDGLPVSMEKKQIKSSMSQRNALRSSGGARASHTRGTSTARWRHTAKHAFVARWPSILAQRSAVSRQRGARWQIVAGLRWQDPVSQRLPGMSWMRGCHALGGPGRTSLGA